MQVIPKGRKCDPCCSDWKAKLQELWEKYQNVVRGVKFGNQDTSYPDGDGIINVDTSGLITVDDALSGSSENPVQNKVVKNKFDSVEGSIASFDSRIDQNADNIDTLEGSISDAEIAISALQSAIVTAQNTIIQLQNTQAETRAIANAAAQTVETYDDRLTDAEANIQTNYDRTVSNESRIDTAEDDIDALETADAQNVKLTGAQTITGVKTAPRFVMSDQNYQIRKETAGTPATSQYMDNTVYDTSQSRWSSLLRLFRSATDDNAFQVHLRAETAGTDVTALEAKVSADGTTTLKGVDPASGATDKSLVTANWVSQTGDSGPNNLLHRTGNETMDGIKTCNGYVNINGTSSSRKLALNSTNLDITSDESGGTPGITFYDKNNVFLAILWIRGNGDGTITLRFDYRKSDGTMAYTSLVSGV